MIDSERWRDELCVFVRTVVCTLSLSVSVSLPVCVYVSVCVCVSDLESLTDGSRPQISLSNRPFVLFYSPYYSSFCLFHIFHVSTLNPHAFLVVLFSCHLS